MRGPPIPEVSVFDAETSVKSPIGSKASPYWPENKGVLYGQNGVVSTTLPTIGKLIVGQNLKFDLAYLRKGGWDFYGWLNDGGRVYDTMIAEYLITAQESKFASLDKLSEKYGGTLKDDKIKAYWDAGVQTEDIPVEELTEYLLGDLENTRIVWERQNATGPLIDTQMDALLAVHEMEYNGMKVDLKKLKEIQNRLKLERDRLHKIITDKLQAHYPQVPDININSGDQLSACLFGGVIKWTEKEQDGYYKSGKRVGQPKFRNIHKEVELKGVYEPKPEWATSKDNVFSTAEAVLEEIGTAFTSKLLEYRKVQKEYSTYAEKLPTMIYPDGCVHHTIHQVSTNTGRLSSAKPNMQNWPSDSEVKAIFVSRFKGGKIVTFDFKQMEVIALAFLSGDEQLIQDVLEGRDIHNETGKVVFGDRPMTKDERRIVKTVNFGLAYGGGAKVLALQAKIEEELAKQIIEAFYHRYPDVHGWQQENIHLVEDNAEFSGDYLKGKPIRRSYLDSVTGRKYLFTETFAPEWMNKPFSFSPTEIKNYPVQGLATGDIVPMMMGRLLRELVRRGLKAKLVNQVHDSILLDVPQEELDTVVECGKMVLESNCFEEVFGVPFLPLKVSIGIGDNWLEADKE